MLTDAISEAEEGNSSQLNHSKLTAIIVKLIDY